MKILIVQDFLRSGGTERQSVLLAQGFADAGHETHLVTFRPDGPLTPSAPRRNLHLRSLQRRDTKLDWWAPGLLRFARSLKPDAILCMGRMANCYGGALQRILPRTAVISTLRTGKPLPALFRRSLAVTRHIVANSREARERILRSHALPPAKVSVIPNGLVFPPLAANTSAQRTVLRQRFGATDRTLVLVDVAMFRPEKNQRALVEIAAGLPAELDWQLWLAGDGPARDECADRALALGVGGRVHFLGWMADPAPIYAGADLAVHASWSESLSNFLIEAQAHGLPAIAYDALGVGETFTPGVSGMLIARDDAPAFRTAILSLARDAGLRRRFGEHGRKQARENFSTGAQIAAYLDCFSRLSRPDSLA